MAPIVHGLEAEYSGKINFVYLDIDDEENDAFKEALGYRVQPHFFLLDDEGKIISQWLGRVTEEQFRSEFDKALNE
jgi:thioredoxin-like negative regulator of GroEL